MLSPWKHGSPGGGNIGSLSFRAQSRPMIGTATDCSGLRGASMTERAYSTDRDGRKQGSRWVEFHKDDLGVPPKYGVGSGYIVRGTLP